MSLPPAYLIVIFAFVFGAIIGSFLNVVILRMRTGRTLGGRSMCFSCGKQLGWRELVPIASFVVQGGKCSGCARRISWQYLTVELITATVFALIAGHILPLLVTTPATFVAYFGYLTVLFSVLITLSGYDMRHTIIPDSLVWSFVVLSFAPVFFAVTHAGIVFAFSLDNLIAGPLLAVPFALLWFVSGGKWMGFGDAKLALGIGFLLGVSSGISALMLSFWIGAVYALVMLLMRKAKLTMKSEIPFAPFLALGMAIVFFCRIDIQTLATVFTF